jgi:DNA polymerase III subunit beta
MKILRDNLLAAIAGPAKLAQKRTTLPILSTLRLESADGKRLHVAGTSLEVLEETSCECDGKFAAACVPAKLFHDSLRRFSEALEIKHDGKHLTLTGGHTAKIALMPAEEFPPGPKVECDPIQIDCKELAAAIESVRHCVSNDPSRLNINHICIQSDAAGFDCVATDGKRLAHLRSESPCGKAELMIFREFLDSAIDALQKDGAVIQQNENTMEFSHAGGRLCFRKSDCGNFPPWRRVIPVDPKQIGTAERESLLNVIAAASAFQTEKSVACKLVFSKTGMEISAGENGNLFSSSLAGKFAPLTIAFDVNLLGDCVAGGGEQIEICGSNELSPLVIRSGNLLQVLMPMRLS